MMREERPRRDGVLTPIRDGWGFTPWRGRNTTHNVIGGRTPRQTTGAPMKIKTIVAVGLIVLGVMAFAYQGISYTTVGRDMNIGMMRMSTQHAHFLPLPPVLGAIALIGGIALLLVDKNDFKSAATP